MRLVIKKIGVVGFVDIHLKKINVIIGPQSLGKSTILKICSYCNWIEKRIQLSQNPNYFKVKGNFVSLLSEFHKLDGYFCRDSYIEYESETMHFAFSWSNEEFLFYWKENKRWNYLMPKISYIPAERNMVAAIPNWFNVELPNNNIRGFMSSWESARKSIKDMSFLNLGLSYHYDKTSQQDKIKTTNNTYLDLTNSSSGIQSLVPMLVYLRYLFNILKPHKNITDFIEDETMNKNSKSSGNITEDLQNKKLREIIYNVVVSHNDLSQSTYYRVLWHYLEPHLCKIFLEEPENSIFPPTQVRLINWLLDNIKRSKDSFVFIATHSPYILNAIFERNEETGAFVVYSDKSGYSYVKSLSREERNNVVQYGLDAFYNIENLTSD